MKTRKNSRSQKTKIKSFIPSAEAKRIRKLVHKAFKTGGPAPDLPFNWGTGQTEEVGEETKEALQYGAEPEVFEIKRNCFANDLEPLDPFYTKEDGYTRNLLIAGNTVAIIKDIDSRLDILLKSMADIYGTGSKPYGNLEPKIKNAKTVMARILMSHLPSLRAYVDMQTKLLKAKAKHRTTFMKLKEVIKTV